MTHKMIVAKANNLTSAAYSLGVAEQRVIFLAIIEAREQNRLIDAEGELRVTAATYAKQFKTTRQTAYEALKTATDTLFDARFYYEKKDEATGKAARHKARWVHDVAYIDEAGTVKIQFSKTVIPLITRLESQYTEYELKQVSELKSEYAIRLYEILIAWKGAKKTPPILLDNLKEQLGVMPNHYERMSNFKARVLDHAIKQINRYTDITATYEQQKEGRIVKAFIFKFQFKNNNQPAKSDKKRLEIKPLTQKQANKFGLILANRTDLGSKAPIGMTTPAYAALLTERLQTAEGVKELMPYLIKEGYKTK